MTLNGFFSARKSDSLILSEFGVHHWPCDFESLVHGVLLATTVEGSGFLSGWWAGDYTGKLTWNPKMEVWFRWFSFSIRILGSSKNFLHCVVRDGWCVTFLDISMGFKGPRQVAGLALYQKAPKFSKKNSICDVCNSYIANPNIYIYIYMVIYIYVYINHIIMICIYYCITYINMHM